MNIRQLLLVLFLFSLSALAFGQRDFTDAADKDFQDQKYAVAIDKYKKAYSKVKDRDERNRIRYQMGECYRLMNEPKRALVYYRGLHRTDYFKKEPIGLLYYADMLRADQNYDEAIVIYEEYMKLRPNDPRGPDGLKSCQMQKEWYGNPTNHIITNIRELNSREDDFAPAYGSEQYNMLIFTSNQEAATGKETDDWTGKKFTDLFFSRMDRKGSWSTPDLLESDGVINTATNEGISTMNSSFTTLYFTRCGNERNKYSGCHIYESRRTGRTYSEPELVNLGGDSTSAIGHPTVSNDENMIVFAADFPNGFGGKDLWYATRKSTSEDFGMAKNLGPVINSAGDELFPFLRSDTVLYFSSNGHIGLGMLDIYKTTYSNGAWGPP
jgi:peptidoglycan-associated lipoprotein